MPVCYQTDEVALSRSDVLNNDRRSAAFVELIHNLSKALIWPLSRETSVLLVSRCSNRFGDLRLGRRGIVIDVDGSGDPYTVTFDLNEIVVSEVLCAVYRLHLASRRLS